MLGTHICGFAHLQTILKLPLLWNIISVNRWNCRNRLNMGNRPLSKCYFHYYCACALEAKESQDTHNSTQKYWTATNHLQQWHWPGIQWSTNGFLKGRARTELFLRSFGCRFRIRSIFNSFRDNRGFSTRCSTIAKISKFWEFLASGGRVVLDSWVVSQIWLDCDSN